MNSSVLLSSFCTLLIYVVSALDPIIVTPLPDGVSIRGGETLRQIIASWDVYVTLDPPPFPEDLAARVVALGHTIDEVAQLAEKGYLYELGPQKLRKNRLMALLGIKKRTKRGLLDVGGSVLHALFGVATNAQLDRYRAAVTEIKGNQQDIAHAYNQLASIVNQTRTYAKALAIRQQQMQDSISKLHRAITLITQHVEENARRINRLEVLTDLDRYIDTLSIATQQYLAQLELFRRQRAELETGRLTRDLLSPAQLNDILAQAAGEYHLIKNVEWYYQSLFVTPLWSDTTAALVYKIELPLIADRPYLLYNIISHPVPINDSDIRVSIDIEPSYALDTVSGKLFIPTRCIGHQPTVCQPAAEFGLTMMTCARGLITNRSNLVKTCRMRVSNIISAPVISTIDLNQFAVTSWGETLIIRCPGLTESHITLKRGAYNLTCIKACTISAEKWSLQCISRSYISRTYTMPEVTTTAHLNISHTLTAKSLLKAIPRLADSHINELTTDIDHLMLNHLSLRQSPKTYGHVLSTINIVIILCICLVLGAMTIYCRRAKSRFSGRINRLASEPEGVPLQELPAPASITTTHAPAQEPTQRIWPDLAQITACLRPRAEAGQPHREVMVPTLQPETSA